MNGPIGLDRDVVERRQLWQHVCTLLDTHAEQVKIQRVSPVLDAADLQSTIRAFDFSRPMDSFEAVRLVMDSMFRLQVHPSHPSYFGLYNPAPTTMGVIAEALVAAFNPNLANWSNSPFGCEVERHLIRSIGAKFGYEQSAVDGVFTSGASEANHTAILTALTAAHPEFRQRGVRALSRQPIFYVSSETHHSLLKAARMCGLGTDAVRQVAVNHRMEIDVLDLERQIQHDIKTGHEPFMVVGTVGTTSSGAIDPLSDLAEVAGRYGLWFHVDAAWAGAIALVPEMRSMIGDIQRADSIAFDAHKWLSVPMGCGMFITRRQSILEQTFYTTPNYMPTDAQGLDVYDDYQHSMSWSKRFSGLKLFMSLLVYGWSGYEESIRQMVKMGQQLRHRLAANHWQLLNETELPLTCFTDASDPTGGSSEFLDQVLREVLSSGKAWISRTILPGGRPALRACVTNFRSGPTEIDALVDLLNLARHRIRLQAPEKVSMVDNKSLNHCRRIR